MPVIKLLSWHTEIAAKAASLKSKGITVDAAPLLRTSAVVGELAKLNPAALVLDLDRLASNSREIALMLRASKSARHIPILFAGALPSHEGLPEKFARLNAELPDIPYASWPDAKQKMLKLLERPRSAPYIVPPLRVYTASLAQKLGILAGAGKTASKPRQVALMGVPEGFVELLGDLPETVTFTSRIGPASHLALCFTRSSEDLAATFELLTLRLPDATSVWIAYPKGNRKWHRDFNENDVRRLGLATGLVDYKICSIDADWSAMKFARRKFKST